MTDDTSTSTPPRRQAWYAPLTASVRALGTAAQEYQLALHNAELAAAQVSPDLRAPHPGSAGHLRVGQPGEVVQPFAPHETAVGELAAFYQHQVDTLRAHHQAAALLFATGCAWAANAAHGGSRPQHVVFTSTPEGQCVPGPLEINGLTNWPRLGELEHARYELAAVMEHQQLAHRINDQIPYTEAVAEQQHQAQQLVDARLGTAAYRYGQLAEEGLHFILAGPTPEAPTHHALATVMYVEEAAAHVPS
ncbi:hypothetical protein [Streptomyces phytophilus]|uniref:hypothetical protein n=1 Tax=Streptomyces phytophilus TaxID=722715 RepID=UPI0015F0B62F|nr:hypothetical protein [Streptomyces phytophilus]